MYQEALAKLSKFCASKERCLSEVRTKLAVFSLSVDEEEDVIAYLIKERFLNERRYLAQYIKSKVHLHKWGKVKIVQFLENKELQSSIIEEVWSKEIDRALYLENFKPLFEKTWGQLSTEEDLNKTKAKLFQHLASKGFEEEFIEKVLEDL